MLRQLDARLARLLGDHRGDRVNGPGDDVQHLALDLEDAVDRPESMRIGCLIAALRLALVPLGLGPGLLLA